MALSEKRKLADIKNKSWYQQKFALQKIEERNEEEEEDKYRRVGKIRKNTM